MPPDGAASMQERLRSNLETDCAIDAEKVRLVAGADVSYMRADDRMFAAVVVMSFPQLQLVESRWGSAPVTFPYLPGFLAFREAPVLLPVFKRLRGDPDLVFFDGHGLAHPRRMGLACHMGVMLGIPTVGVAKSVLVGEYEIPGWKKGSSSPLVDRDETVGTALRTRNGVKPVFVSVGHLAELESAVELVLACCPGYRLPEPIRAAHSLCSEARRLWGNRMT